MWCHLWGVLRFGLLPTGLSNFGNLGTPTKVPLPHARDLRDRDFWIPRPKITTRIDFHGWLGNFKFLMMSWPRPHPSPLWMTHPKNPLRELGFDLPLILYGFDDLPNGGYFVKKCHHSVKYIWSTTIYHYRIWLPFYVMIYIPWITKNISLPYLITILCNDIHPMNN